MMINYTALLGARKVSTQRATCPYSKQVQDKDALKQSFGRDTVSLGSNDTRYETYSASSVSTIKAAAKSSTVSQDTAGSSSVEEPSVYDMTDKEIRETLRKVEQEGKAADYTGMSDVEIYRAITERYTTAFGADFMDEWQLNVPREASFYDIMVISYEHELSNHFGTNVSNVARRAIYGDKSTDEIISAIMEKYPPVNQQTYREAFLMAGEMRQVNVDKGCLYSLLSDTVGLLYDTHFNSTVTHRTYTSEERNQYITQLLDDRLDPSAMAFAYNVRKHAGRSMPPATGVMMTSLFGLSLGANGMFSEDFDLEEYFLKSWNQSVNTVDDVLAERWKGDR